MHSPNILPTTALQEGSIDPRAVFELPSETPPKWSLPISNAVRIDLPVVSLNRLPTDELVFRLNGKIAPGKIHDLTCAWMDSGSDQPFSEYLASRDTRIEVVRQELQRQTASQLAPVATLETVELTETQPTTPLAT